MSPSSLPRPHTLLAEHQRHAEWHETTRMPSPLGRLRRADEFRRSLETISLVLVLVVIAEHLDEANIRMVVLDDGGRTLAIISGDGRPINTRPTRWPTCFAGRDLTAR